MVSTNRLGFLYVNDECAKPPRVVRSVINRGTGVPPVHTAGTAVPRRSAQPLTSLRIEGEVPALGLRRQRSGLRSFGAGKRPTVP